MLGWVIWVSCRARALLASCSSTLMAIELEGMPFTCRTLSVAKLVPGSKFTEDNGLRMLPRAPAFGLK